MNRTDVLIGSLSPDVGRFVLQGLRQLEQENVFDAPGVISGIVRRMQAADSAPIRAAAANTERILHQIFAQRHTRQARA